MLIRRYVCKQSQTGNGRSGGAGTSLAVPCLAWPGLAVGCPETTVALSDTQRSARLSLLLLLLLLSPVLGRRSQGSIPIGIAVAFFGRQWSS